MKSREEVHDLFCEYSKMMYDCYCKLFDLYNDLPKVLDIDGNSPRKKELLDMRNELLQLHYDSMDYVNNSLN